MAKAEAVQGIESHAEALGCILLDKGKEQKNTTKQNSWTVGTLLYQSFITLRLF